jgi:hypothetical protein
MLDILLDPKVMTFVCFGWWAIGTVLYILITIFKPVSMMGKINWREPRDLIMISSGMAWIAMWCFRTMY